MSNNAIYLSLDGKVSGPFTSGHIEDLRQSGELYSYSWIWAGDEKGWTAIEEEVEIPASAPVPPPPDAAAAPKPSKKITFTAPLPEPELPQRTPVSSEKLEWILQNIHVICHNRKTAMSGKIGDAYEKGCTLQSSLPSNDLPTFKIGTQISMNLLNPISGSSENTSVTIENAKRGDDFWIYQLSWKQFPNILVSGG